MPLRARPREARGRRGAATATAQPTRLVRAPHSRAPVAATAVSIVDADALLRPHRFGLRERWVRRKGGLADQKKGSAARKKARIEPS